MESASPPIEIMKDIKWTSVAGIGGFLLLCLFAVFTPGGPGAGTHGVVFAAAGLLLICFPPSYRGSRTVMILGALLLVISALAFLPAGIFGKADWRVELDGLGLGMGSLFTAHPAQSLELLLGLGISVLVATYLLGHRVSIAATNTIALAFVVGVGGYALLSILAQENDWRFAWDEVPSFGLFPNRNHTATLLVMGALCGLGVLQYSIVSRRWLFAVLAAVCIGICTWTILGISVSRAGPILLAAGFVAWLLGLGRRHLSHRIVVSVLVLGGLAVFLFVAADSEVKSRFEKTIEKLESDEAGIGTGLEAGRQVAAADSSFDFRVVIHRDALAMIADEPWIGVGQGMFRYVFPQYRNHSANNSLALHPESDWLFVAAESGIVAALVLLAGVLYLFVYAFRRGRKRSGWPLRLSCLLAAAVVPVHGLFDVPGHRVGLAYSALLLLALGTCKSRKAPSLGRAGRLAFQVAGALVLMFGFHLIRSEWLGGEPSANARAEVVADEIRALYAQDVDEQAKIAAGQPPHAGSSKEGEDKIELALALAEEGIKAAPLDPELHYLRGAMALYFDDKEDVVERSFAIQRRLDPTWVNLPLRQAKGWLPIDRDRTLALWADAMRRAAKLAPRSEALQRQPARVWVDILAQCKGDPALYGRALDLVDRSDAEALQVWIQHASPALRLAHLPRILSAESLGAIERGELIELWKKLGNAADAEEFLAEHPDLLIEAKSPTGGSELLRGSRR